MGAYSSWAVFAFSHHLVVFLAGKRVGQSLDVTLTQYAIVGDDIVIFDEQLANAYVALLKKLNVEISVSKSVVPTRPESTGVEFLAKWYVNGRELSRLPFTLLTIDLPGTPDIFFSELMYRFLQNLVLGSRFITTDSLRMLNILTSFPSEYIRPTTSIVVSVLTLIGAKLYRVYTPEMEFKGSKDIPSADYCDDFGPLTVTSVVSWSVQRVPVDTLLSFDQDGVTYVLETSGIDVVRKHQRKLYDQWVAIVGPTVLANELRGKVTEWCNYLKVVKGLGQPFGYGGLALAPRWRLFPLSPDQPLSQMIPSVGRGALTDAELRKLVRTVLTIAGSESTTRVDLSDNLLSSPPELQDLRDTLRKLVAFKDPGDNVR